MKRLLPDSTEKLIRLRATRRGTIVELLVHYEVYRENGCDTYRIVTIAENE